MSLRRIEARFLLPHPVRRAALLGADGWREELERAGVEVGNGAVDVVVASAERAAEARAIGAPATIVEGKGARLHGSRSYLPLPGHVEPLVFVPLGRGRPARYAVEQWAFAGSRPKQARNRLLGMLAASRGTFPPVRPVIAVAAPPEPPFLVRAAHEHGVPADAEPLLVPGQGDDYSRAAFLLFERGAGEPSWALKFGRLPVVLPSFDREDHGLELAREAGGVVASHAPRRLARFEADGLQCALETAARGKPLLAILHAAPGEAEKLRLVDQICDWLLEVARSTAAPPEALEPERRRLATEVLPAWGLGPELAERLPAVPAVLQHNDVGSWNVLVGGDGFTVLDWEDAVRHGLPLWDLLYFLANAAANLEGMGSQENEAAHFEQLFAGERPLSAFVLARVRRMVEALALPAEAVGPIATLCWLHHGLAGERRAEGSGPARENAAPDVSRSMAERWLRHPALGTGWSRWAE